MKKILCSIALALVMMGGARADEGMWLLPLLEKLNAEAMADLGCRLSPEQIYSINNSSLKDAIVIFGGGCTGEMISGEGLLVTNHHCGYGTIQQLSSPEHNYLEDGFWAMSREEEIPAPGLSVTFMQSMTDVTDVVAKADAKGPETRQAVIDEMQKKIEAQNPGCRARVTSFYSENVYYLIVTKTYKDVRFVGAPPASSGKFGGDTDNWMWPRHTCDFSMFRVYAGADNEPADYSADNKPYNPAQSLKISLKGIEEGDFAMIMGYPGSTQRYQTAAQLQDMIETNDIRIAARTVRQDIMWDARMADEKVNLQYASKYASSSNGWKKWQGEKECFEDLKVIEREQQKEADFMTWVGKNKKRQAKYGTAIDVIAADVAAKAPAKKAVTLLTESAGRIEVVGFALAFSAPSRMMMRPDAGPVDPAKQFEGTKARVMSAFKDYSEPLDRREAVALLGFYRDNALPENYIEIPGYDFATMDLEAYVASVFDNTVLTSAEKLSGVASMDDLASDPAMVLCKAIQETQKKIQGGGPAGMPAGMPGMPGGPARPRTAVEEANKAYTAGLMEWYGDKPLYPDANFTMRLTYGSVKSYSPKDAVHYLHYTTLKGVMEKEDPSNYEFRVPARLKEIYEARDYGQYADANGDMPACFLMTGDITGGNSGSPVMDADGNLIGLAFDGNWEAMSGDVIFEPNLQRCICVDIRYVLLMMDKFGGAGYLLDEMTLVK